MNVLAGDASNAVSAGPTPSPPPPPPPSAAGGDTQGLYVQVLIDLRAGSALPALADVASPRLLMPAISWKCLWPSPSELRRLEAAGL